MSIITKREYYSNPDIYHFNAEIVDITNENGHFKVQLDITYFYPEGGGQPGDRGYIAGIEVLNTVAEDNIIYHLMVSKPLIGDTKCQIDREHREHFMIQHTGQHLISGVLHKELNIVTKSVHLGRDETTIEIDRNSISSDEILVIENKSNMLIRSNTGIKYHETDDEGIKELNTRRVSKYSGYIRVVELDGYDMVPCGGLHLKSLSKIGLVKIVGYEKIRGNIRLKILIGENAYRDYRLKNDITNHLNSTLSTQTHEILDGVNILKKTISGLKLKQKETFKAFTLMIREQVVSNNPGILEFTNIPTELFKSISADLTSRLHQPLIILNIGNKRLNWALIDSLDDKVDFEYFKNNLLPAIQGKGGGKSKIWQGSGENEDLKEFKKKTINFLAKYK